MKDSELVEIIVYNGKLIKVGLDDAGQNYFIEFWTDDGYKTLSVGSYNTDYLGFIEYVFGDPEAECATFERIKHEQRLAKDNLPEDCPTPLAHGYCDNCKYHDYEYFVLNELKNMGVVDRHTNKVNKRFRNLLQQCLAEEEDSIQ